MVCQMSFAGNSISLYAHDVLDSSVMSASPEKLISMLFNGAQISIVKAQQHIAAGDAAGRSEAIAKAIEIVDNGLRTALRIRDSDEMARQLNSLYLHITRHHAQANLTNDIRHLDAVVKLLSDLRSAWSGIKPLLSSRNDIYYLPRSAGSNSRRA